MLESWQLSHHTPYYELLRIAAIAHKFKTVARRTVRSVEM